jgi:hypothetical protein
MNEQINTAIETARTLDEKAKIVGSFVIERTPEVFVFAPSEISEACVGLELPIRHPDFIKFGKGYLMTEHDDLLASILIQDKHMLADWFDTHASEARKHSGFPAWGFDLSSSKVAIDSYVSSETYYRYLQAKQNR